MTVEAKHEQQQGLFLFEKVEVLQHDPHKTITDFESPT